MDITKISCILCIFLLINFIGLEDKISRNFLYNKQMSNNTQIADRIFLFFCYFKN